MSEKAPAAEAAAQSLRQTIEAVRRLFHALAGADGRARDESGITASMRAVLEVLHEGGPRPVPRIARVLGVSRQHVQVVANALMAAGLVETIGNPDHLRSPLLRASPAGARVCEAVRRREGRLLAEAAKRIPGGDLKVTLKTLQAMEAGLGRMQTRS
jgi:DNA-binding MarR family transcriptional regulator